MRLPEIMKGDILMAPFLRYHITKGNTQQNILLPKMRGCDFSAR